jgi:hypothetical protein
MVKARAFRPKKLCNTTGRVGVKRADQLDLATVWKSNRRCFHTLFGKLGPDLQHASGQTGPRGKTLV